MFDKELVSDSLQIYKCRLTHYHVNRHFLVIRISI